MINNNIKITDRENINFSHMQVKNTPRIARVDINRSVIIKASVGMYSGCDYLLSLKILFVYFLALPSLLHPSILFNCFYTCIIHVYTGIHIKPLPVSRVFGAEIVMYSGMDGRGWGVWGWVANG